MTIRSRLLLFLLPPITLLILLVTIFAYFDWYHSLLITAVVSAIILWIVLFFVAKKISQPVIELKDSALAIAAGNYNTHINVKGPKEIIELASTLNTMSACLKEQITQLQENAFAKELHLGEHECALLLKKYMVHKAIENVQDTPFTFHPLFISSNHPKGLLLNITENNFYMYEASKTGFDGMFDLLTGPKEDFASLHLQFDDLSFNCSGLFPPVFWPKNEKASYIFVYNKTFHDQFQNQKAIQDWFEKILHHFANDGLEAVSSMLEKELLFFSRKRNIDEDLNIICMKRKDYET